LLQHATNPVDWYPWCDEAFTRAQNEDKPVFLSIGYSSCHWCHVMAHESFENPQIAAFLNSHYICIKVDREERPDIDHIYMQAVQVIAGSGGWPLSVFLTPDRQPFAGGTYFPPEDRYTLPGFLKVLQSVLEAFRERRRDLAEIGRRIRDNISYHPGPDHSLISLSEEILKNAMERLSEEFDGENGGFGSAPKFPQAMVLEFLLLYHRHFHDQTALSMVELSLDKMAEGGIYDQVGGGFHRYSTDDHWLVPHFEKMLYDNALLAGIYLTAYRVTQNIQYARIVKETLDYLLREMRSPDGAFYSSQDADVSGREGRYYLWSDSEISSVLPADQANLVKQYYAISSEGNFDGSNILHLAPDRVEIDNIQPIKSCLLQARLLRPRPGRDEKVLSGWNGLLLKVLSEAADVFDRSDYLAAALALAEFLTGVMFSGATLKHSYLNGKSPVEGFLEDYASVCEGLLALHRSTLNPRWLVIVINLTKIMMQQFESSEGLLFDTPKSQTDLFVRPRNSSDGSTPSGVAIATGLLLKLSILTGHQDYRQVAERNLSVQLDICRNYPLSAGFWLKVIDYCLSDSIQIVIAGDHQADMTQTLGKLIKSEWRPHTILTAFLSGSCPELDDLALFNGRGMRDGRPTVYLCRNYSCQAPVNSTAEVEQLLQENP
jgi:uncharacterized protein